MYVGRFAPSPTGPLHFGSLVAALAGWLDARHAGGRWIVRIEDLDRPRVQPGAADAILRSLQHLGLYWDGPVVFQSARAALYESAVHRLRDRTYWCGCTRREIADSSLGIASDGASIYPGTCRAGLAPGKSARSVRIRTGQAAVRFEDRVQGLQEQALGEAVGDFVLLRADGQASYQLAVVVDDEAQGVTHVVRGADLLDSTARQIYLQELLGYRLPVYMHVPVATDASGAKLSKQTGARPIDAIGAHSIRHALRFLGQPETDDLAQAARHWDVARIPRVRALSLAATGSDHAEQ
jgi:glutamyl-Q tRNA(Asp) synthetase